MNGWTPPLEKRGVMRTKHMDQHVNSRLPTPWAPHGWSRPQSFRGCRGLRGLPPLAGNQDLCPGCQSGHSGLVLPNALNYNGAGSGKVSEENGQAVSRLPCHRERSSLRGSLGLGRPCRSAQNLSLSHARSSVFPHSHAAILQPWGKHLLAPPSPEDTTISCNVADNQRK